MAVARMKTVAAVLLAASVVLVGVWEVGHRVLTAGQGEGKRAIEEKTTGTPPAAAWPERTTVNGRVVDHRGAPVANAEVLLLGEERILVDADRRTWFVPEEEKVRRGDYFYVNDGSLEELDAFVAAVLEELRASL